MLLKRAQSASFGFPTVKCQEVDQNPILLVRLHVNSTLKVDHPIFYVTKCGINCIFTEHTATGDVSYNSKHKSKGETPLLLAVLNNQLPIVSHLLSHGSSIEETTKYGMTSVQVAAAEGYLELLQFLLNNGCSLETHYFGMSCLHLAAQRGQLKVVQWLIKNGCSITQMDIDGMTSLLYAATGGFLDMVKWLINEGSSLNEQNYNEVTSLLAAAEGGHLETVIWLLENGCSLEERDDTGRTCLLCAASGGHIDTIKWLLDYGSDIEEKDEFEANCILIAAANGHLETVKWLSDKGCTISKTCDPLPILVSAAAGNHVEVVQFLLLADVNPKGVLQRLSEQEDAHLEPDPSFELLETLVNYGGVSVVEIQSHCKEEHFSAFMVEMRRKKTNKRAAH